MLNDEYPARELLAPEIRGELLLVLGAYGALAVMLSITAAIGSWRFVALGLLPALGLLLGLRTVDRKARRRSSE